MGFLNGKDVNVVVHYEFEDRCRREDAMHIPCSACDLFMGGFFIFIFIFLGGFLVWVVRVCLLLCDERVFMVELVIEIV